MSESKKMEIPPHLRRRWNPIRGITGGRHIRRNRQMVIGGVIILAFILLALVVAVTSALHIQITPYNPIEQNVGRPLAPPSAQHLMGTDVTGEDVFSRIVAATPNGVLIGFGVVTVAMAVGLIVGSFAGYWGGLLDEALMRITDIFFALPALILAIAIAVALGVGLLHMMLALMIIWWPAYARLARGEALKVKHQNYVEASKVSGHGAVGIVARHVIPNIFIIMLVYATLDIGTVLLVYSGLSYLGLSIPPPAPDWGQMVSAYQDFLISAPWLPIFPGVTIALGVIGFSIFGDGLRDALEVG